MFAPKKVVLAYSGGLDTSIILKWLQTEYGCEVVTFTADLGQGEELEPARAKAEMLGIAPANIFIEDLREEFVRDFVFPMFRANALYEGLYLLGTSIARPLISKRLVEIAAIEGADAVAHGATGKGNDQVRFELAAYALNPDIKVIAPWREWDLTSRTKLLEFAEANQIPVAKDKLGDQLKTAFMRGVCQLNLETASILGPMGPAGPDGDGSSPADGSAALDELEPAPRSQTLPRPTRAEDVLAAARRGLEQVAQHRPSSTKERI